MGLDITAYSNLQHIGKHTKDPKLNEGEPGGIDDWCYYDNHVQAFAYDCFPASFRGIRVVGTKAIGDATFIEAGCYETTDKTETHGFRAGSYIGYNRWRSDLQDRFNPDRNPDGPFYELIWFADNEGCIGPEAAADLLADFREHDGAYRATAPESWYAEKYTDWTTAFELASRAGLVRFH